MPTNLLKLAWTQLAPIVNGGRLGVTCPSTSPPPPSSAFLFPHLSAISVPLSGLEGTLVINVARSRQPADELVATIAYGMGQSGEVELMELHEARGASLE
jgi:hypothetical protein